MRKFSPITIQGLKNKIECAVNPLYFSGYKSFSLRVEQDLSKIILEQELKKMWRNGKR